VNKLGDALEGIRATTPDVVLLDLDLGGHSSLDFLPELLELSAARIIASGNGDGGDVVLTADTAELQRFVRKHLKNADAWSELEVMKRQ
jgi:chemotaxis response regulator CheB